MPYSESVALECFLLKGISELASDLLYLNSALESFSHGSKEYTVDVE